MLHCRDPEYGFLTYKCPQCGKIKTVPLTCKSRICTSCGKKHADEWAEKLAQNLYSVLHRHMIFTIPEQLRLIFKADHTLLKVLMDAVSLTLKKMIETRRKATPGLIAVLHPYGKVLNLLRKLRKIYQYHLLTAIKKHIPKTPQNSRFIDTLFKNYPEGFYVRAKRRVPSSERKDVARYIGRYIRHPAIAESCITEFNSEANTVTFWYRDGEGWNSATKKVTMPAMEFIDRLVKLIPG